MATLEGIGADLKKKIKKTLAAGGAQVDIMDSGQAKDGGKGFALVGDKDNIEKAKSIMAKVSGVAATGSKTLHSGRQALTYKMT
jgi:hypothetical protein